jgi:hypothetical protein
MSRLLIKSQIEVTQYIAINKFLWKACVYLVYYSCFDRSKTFAPLLSPRQDQITETPSVSGEDGKWLS